MFGKEKELTFSLMGTLLIGHGVVTAFAPRMTTGNASDAQIASVK